MLFTSGVTIDLLNKIRNILLPYFASYLYCIYHWHMMHSSYTGWCIYFFLFMLNVCCNLRYFVWRLEEEEELSHKRSLVDVSSCQATGTVRRSFFQRHRHHTGSKESHDLNLLSDASLNSDSIRHLDGLFCTFQYFHLSSLYIHSSHYAFFICAPHYGYCCQMYTM